MIRPVIGVLGYVRQGGRVLLVHRSRDGDDHRGKWIGLGGKLEPDEDVLSCLRRELREEAGIEVRSAELRGTISWPGFGSDGADWFGLVFVVDDFDGEPPERNDDGPLAWVPVAEVMDLPMWEGDRYFVPLVLDEDPRPFHAVMPYRDGELVADAVVISR
ncbi:MAG: 8-oxo-dGTP diphosphatase [Arachnia propionica]|uniref:NUDIX hydrolase n=1 Tax=Arachnia propionica TaxID=1750 RepID=UPI0026FD7361|nr:8-oxo-dGTP diphosphatase [Arachnia propionica]